MAPPVEPPSSITIRIKVPPGHIPGGADEFTLGSDIPVASKIGHIRERIQEAIPSSPTPERQRVLYGGRALVDNEQSVADALNIRRDPSQKEYVVHLLVKGEGDNTAPIPQRRGVNTPNRSSSPAQPGVSTGVHPPAPGQAQQPVPQNAQQIHQHFVNQEPRAPNQGGFHVQGVGPNGERVMIHQQTMNFPHFGQHVQHTPQLIPGMPGVHGPPGMHGVPGMPGMAPFGGFGALPGMPHQPRPSGPSALDQARQNIVEMRRMLNELRSSEAASESQRAEITRLEERTQALSDYIDPLRLGGGIQNRPRSQSPRVGGETNGMGLPTPPPASDSPASMLAGWQQRAQQLRQVQQQASPAPSNPTDVTCYLLSSPLGPQAILHSPQHGTFTGTPQYQAPTGLRPTPTSAAQSHAPSAAGENHAVGNEVLGDALAPNHGQEIGGQQIQAQVQAQAVQQDPMGPLGPLLGHMWLLLRILIFSYFLLGSNMGWRRPLALAAIGLGFWMIRAGLLGDGGAIRRWWDGIMNDGQRPAPADGQAPPQQGQQQGPQQDQQQAQGNGRAGQMPTPEQLAQRLLNEDAQARDQARNERYQWLRERARPIERAIALLVASLWPGVGEAYVRAREQEERRRAEEEIAARRREEEERQRMEDEKQQKEQEGDHEGGDKSEPVERDETGVDAATAEQTSSSVDGGKAGPA